MHNEGRLHGMKLTIALQALDRGDALALLHRGQTHTREHAAAVEVHRACSTFAAVTALFRAGQQQRPTQSVEKSRPRLNHRGAVAAVDRQAHRPCVESMLSGRR